MLLAVKIGHVLSSHTNSNAKKLKSSQKRLTAKMDYVASLVQWQMSLIVRKPVFGFFDHVRHKPGCTAAGDDKRLEILFLGSRGIVLAV